MNTLELVWEVVELKKIIAKDLMFIKYIQKRMSKRKHKKDFNVWRVVAQIAIRVLHVKMCLDKVKENISLITKSYTSNKGIGGGILMIRQ